jgi:hypothetical protein
MTTEIKDIDRAVWPDMCDLLAERADILPTLGNLFPESETWYDEQSEVEALVATAVLSTSPASPDLSPDYQKAPIVEYGGQIFLQMAAYRPELREGTEIRGVTHRHVQIGELILKEGEDPKIYWNESETYLDGSTPY